MLSYVHGAGAVLFFTAAPSQADQRVPADWLQDVFAEHTLVAAITSPMV
ncbi:hypothetical protein ACLK1S_04055 [Escherichia coli]